MWPELTLSVWEDTRDTVHLWTQVVGKVRLALEPMVTHWWQIPLYVSTRGLTTSLMHAGGRGLKIEFDFIDHVLVLRTTMVRSAGSLLSRARSPTSTKRSWRPSTSSASTWRCSPARSR